MAGVDVETSTAIDELLMRNLLNVFGERAPRPRQRATDQLFEPDCVFVDPAGRHVNRLALDTRVMVLQAAYPDHRFTRIDSFDTLVEAGRLAWAFGRTDNPRKVTGLDIAIVKGSRIAALYTFVESPDA